jgi:hypothetical protein
MALVLSWRGFQMHPTQTDRRQARHGRRTHFKATLASGLLLGACSAFAQAPDLGVAAVTLDADSYRFDTAEQHGIRVDVVARGLSHPFSLSFLSATAAAGCRV